MSNNFRSSSTPTLANQKVAYFLKRHKRTRLLRNRAKRLVAAESAARKRKRERAEHSATVHAATLDEVESDRDHRPSHSDGVQVVGHHRGHCRLHLH